jgi:hypothetical protein
MPPPLAALVGVSGAFEADFGDSKAIYVDSTSIEGEFIVSASGNNGK